LEGTRRSSPPPEQTIFISYRREDSEHVTGRIYDRLEAHFRRDRVFLDVDNIPLGVDFRKHLDEAVGQCDVLLAVIGEGWLDVCYPEGPKRGRRRLDDPADFVRIEIESALARNIHVIPVLVGKAAMPREEDLPDLLKPLASRQAAPVRGGRDFRGDVDRLIDGIDRLLGSSTRNLGLGASDLQERQPAPRLLTLTVPRRVEVVAGRQALFTVRVARENVEGGVAVRFAAPADVTLHGIAIPADQSEGQASITADVRATEGEHSVEVRASCGSVNAAHQNMSIGIRR
jgi:hypothetical protein